MSKRPGLFSLIWKQLTKGYEPYKEKFVGKDVYGNLFYESNKPNYRGQPTRFHSPTVESDRMTLISPEWDSWLRYRRQEPPTEAEVLTNVKISEMKKVNAAGKQQQSNKKYSNMSNLKRSNQNYNEFNESFPKHRDIETNPGLGKKS